MDPHCSDYVVQGSAVCSMNVMGHECCGGKKNKARKGVGSVGGECHWQCEVEWLGTVSLRK